MLASFYEPNSNRGDLAVALVVKKHFLQDEFTFALPQDETEDDQPDDTWRKGRGLLHLRYGEVDAIEDSISATVVLTLFISRF